MRALSLWIFSLLFFCTAVWHFRMPGFFVRITPPWVPWPRRVNAFVTLFELALALSLQVPQLQRRAIFVAIAFLIAVTPVHLRMKDAPAASLGLPRWFLVGRVWLQVLLVAWLAACL